MPIRGHKAEAAAWEAESRCVPMPRRNGDWLVCCTVFQRSRNRLKGATQRIPDGLKRALTNFVNMALYYLFLDEITFNISFNSLGGKVDLQISVECESAIYYIAKYGTKTEQNSKDLDALTKDFSEKVFKMKAQLKQSFEVPIQ